MCGVDILQNENAEDDEVQGRVNAGLIIRQDTGFPLSSDDNQNWILPFNSKFSIFHILKQGSKQFGLDMEFIAVSGEILEENLLLMDESDIEFLLLLKHSLKDYNDILSSYKDNLKYNFQYYDEDAKEFGITIKKRLFGHGPIRYFHLFWNSELSTSEEHALEEKIINEENFIKDSINHETELTEFKITQLKAWFDLECIESNTVNTTNDTKESTYILQSYSRNDQAIKKDFEKCGFYILVSSKNITKFEAKTKYLKCRYNQKMMQLVVDNFLVTKFDRSIKETSDSITKGIYLIWYLASILNTRLLIKSMQYIEKNNHTLDIVMYQLKSIAADLDLKSNKYILNKEFNKYQQEIAAAFNFSEKDVEEFISSL